MANTNAGGDKVRSGGPYTPATTAANTGHKSGGEWNWENSSATPTKVKK